jgi:hypothetical protein
MKAKRSPGGAKASRHCVHEGIERQLHVAVAYWCAPKAVVSSNSLFCPQDCVLGEWGSWLRAVKTM